MLTQVSNTGKLAWAAILGAHQIANWWLPNARQLLIRCIALGTAARQLRSLDASMADSMLATILEQTQGEKKLIDTRHKNPKKKTYRQAKRVLPVILLVALITIYHMAMMAVFTSG